MFVLLFSENKKMAVECRCRVRIGVWCDCLAAFVLLSRSGLVGAKRIVGIDQQNADGKVQVLVWFIIAAQLNSCHVTIP